MLRIGLTGGIGAGKSTVSATFAECGGIIVDGDVIAREVVEPGTPGLAQLVSAFGDDILLPDGALNRPALAAKAFVDDEKRAQLNGIVHPLVGSPPRGDPHGGERRCRGGGGHPASRRNRAGAAVPACGRGDGRHRNSSDPGRQAGDGRGRRACPHQGTGARGAAPRDSRCAAGQFGCSGRAGRKRPRRVGRPDTAAGAQHPYAAVRAEGP